jgi:hypothetical protein
MTKQGIFQVPLTKLALGLSIVAGASACSEPFDPPPPDTNTGVSSLPICDTPLSVTPEDPSVTAFGLVQLVATGGSGAYVFSVTEDRSGASVNVTTGAYQAGATADVADILTVTDAACAVEVTTTINVLSHIEATPDELHVPPGTAVWIDVAGGSGTFGCRLDSDTSGGTLTECAYLVGPAQGTDVVRVEDRVTGAFDDVIIVSDPAATFVVAGAGHLFLPRGSRFVPTAEGGSGSLVVDVLEGALTVDGGAILATTAGRGTVRVSDRYTSFSVEIPVDVLAPLSAELPRDGERSGEGVVLPAGDIDGDGYEDAVLGFIELGIDASYGGGVLVYAGGPDGLGPTPVLTLAGAATEDTLGRAVAVADLDGDGASDLVVGVDKTDQGGTNVGMVRIYPGTPGAFFSDAPARTLGGENEFGRFGSALAVCDFDADGWLDLAVGAVEDSDLAAAEPADDQGAVHVFKGGADGFGDRADFVLYGEVSDGAGGFASQPGMQLGAALVAGDLDGDGLCDLVAGAQEGSYDGAGGDGDGVVLVYRGTLEDGLTLTRDPAAFVVPTSTVDGLGRRLAIGDVDGDTRADLAVAEWKADRGSADGGGVWLFRGLDFDVLAADLVVDTSDADWWVFGQLPGGTLGSAVDLADLDGDGLDELIVGAYLSGVEDAGAVYAWQGAELADALPGTDATGVAPWRTVEGASADGRFGQAVAGIGDADGDGTADLLTLAGYDSSWGVEAGAAWFVGAAGATLLDWPGAATGHEIGRAVTLFDMDADGAADLVVGAPDAPDAAVGANSGVLLAWTSAWEGDGTPILGRHATHAAGDRFGYGVSTAGDFDGDGYEDLAVIARKDGQPSAWAATDDPDASCVEDAVTNAGSVLVYRGGPGGIPTEPAFVTYGIGEYVYGVEGGFDHDGDGYDDLLVRSWSWTDTGGFAIVYGRPASDGLAILCDTERYLGGQEFDRLGYGGAALGDLDGDGCDELAVGATGEELDDDYDNQGSVRVLWGWGGDGCPDEPEVSTFTLDSVGTGLGSALAGGGDVDGDGLPDLVVGAAEYRVEFAEVGAAWLVPGWHLLAAPRAPLVDSALPEDALAEVTALLPRGGLDVNYGLQGGTAGALFGKSVALVPDPLLPGRAAVVVGAPQGATGGTDLAGGAAVYRWSEAGLDPVPWAIVGGESAGPGGGLGATLFGGHLGGAVDNGPVLVVGAPESHQAGTEIGAVYVVRLGE